LYIKNTSNESIVVKTRKPHMEAATIHLLLFQLYTISVSRKNKVWSPSFRMIAMYTN